MDEPKNHEEEKITQDNAFEEDMSSSECSQQNT